MTIEHGEMIKVEVVKPHDWAAITNLLHHCVFGSHLKPDQERISFALLGRKDDEVLGFVTCLETDSNTLYWKFGGTVPGARQTSMSWLLYQRFVNLCKEKYERITTLIENDNITMLKMAMKVGFRIIGVRIYNGQILLEHLLERGV